MKIYDSLGAPNPRRVRVFLAEKGITNVPFVQVNIATAENRKPEFLKINPMGGLPVLELDDGTHIAESVAICRYFETIKPEPPLMGVDAKDKAVVEMWNRRMEFEILVDDGGVVPQHQRFLQGPHPAGQGIRRDREERGAQTPRMARHGAGRSRIHRGPALHDCGYHCA